MKPRAREPLSRSEKASVLFDASREGVTAAARRAGVPRASIYRWRARAARDGVEALPPASRAGTPLEANRLDSKVQAAVMMIAREHPHLGPGRAAQELRRRGVVVSSSAVHSTWVRNGLATLPERARAARMEMERPQAAITDAGIVSELAALRAEVARLAEQQARTISSLERQDRGRRSYTRSGPVLQRSQTRGQKPRVLRQLFGDAMPAESPGLAETSESSSQEEAIKTAAPSILTMLFGIEAVAGGKERCNSAQPSPAIPTAADG